MAMITYDDKQAMGTQPTIPEVNKVTDSDMNEIKTAINNNTTYSNTEKVIGFWVDNKPIYSQTINFGSLPNNGSKNVAHNISNIDKVVNYRGIAYSSSAFRTLPTCSPLNLTYNIDLYVDTTDIHIITGIDRTSYTSYVTIEYTKTTD